MVQALIQRGGLDADRIRRRTPAGEFGTPEEVADVMACSDKARYVTATSSRSTAATRLWLSSGCRGDLRMADAFVLPTPGFEAGYCFEE